MTTTVYCAVPEGSNISNVVSWRQRYTVTYRKASTIVTLYHDHNGILWRTGRQQHYIVIRCIMTTTAYCDVPEGSNITKIVSWWQRYTVMCRKASTIVTLYHDNNDIQWRTGKNQHYLRCTYQDCVVTYTNLYIYIYIYITVYRSVIL